MDKKKIKSTSEKVEIISNGYSNNFKINQSDEIVNVINIKHGNWNYSETFVFDSHENHGLIKSETVNYTF